MSRNQNRQPGPGQEELFAIEAPKPPYSDLPPQELTDIGAAVDVTARAVEMGHVFKELNTANSRAGLQMAAATPYRHELARRYSNLDSVVERAGYREGHSLREAKRHFETASGKYALIGAGVSKETAAKQTDELWRAFTAKYGVGVTTGKVRNDKAKEIKRSANFITGKKLK